MITRKLINLDIAACFNYFKSKVAANYEHFKVWNHCSSKIHKEWSVYSDCKTASPIFFFQKSCNITPEVNRREYWKRIDIIRRKT